MNSRNTNTRGNKPTRNVQNGLNVPEKLTSKPSKPTETKKS